MVINDGFLNIVNLKVTAYAVIIKEVVVIINRSTQVFRDAWYAGNAIFSINAIPAILAINAVFAILAVHTIATVFAIDAVPAVLAINAIFAVQAVLTIDAIFAIGTVLAVNAVFTIGAILAVGTVFTVCTIGAVLAIDAIRAGVSLIALGTLRADLAAFALFAGVAFIPFFAFQLFGGDQVFPISTIIILNIAVLYTHFDLRGCAGIGSGAAGQRQRQCRGSQTERSLFHTTYPLAIKSTNIDILIIQRNKAESQIKKCCNSVQHLQSLRLKFS